VKAVLDTNVLISGFLADGVCARILRRARNGDFLFVLPTVVLEEFERVLKNKFRLDDGEVSFFSAIVSEAAGEIHQPVKPVEEICRDRDDDVILACATEGQADFLVTGDDDPLVLKACKRTKILRPRDFELLFDD